MHDEPCAKALAVRKDREQLHPARINPDERLVRGRWQARNRPIVTLGPTRDRDTMFAIGPENLQNLLRLRPAKQLLKPRNIFESLFQGLGSLVDIGEACLAFEPGALLLW